MAAKVLTEAGAASCCSRPGPSGTRTRTARCSSGTTTRRGAAPARAQRPFGEFDGCLGGWDLEGEPYTVGRGRASSCGSARACWAAAPTTGAASRLRFGPWDFKAPQPRRPGRRLADRLRRHQAVLRQARRAGRASSARTRACRTSRTASSCRRPRRAPTSCWSRRPATSSASPASPRASRSSRKPLERPAGLPLLRPVRPRLRDALELLDALGAAAARPGDGPAQDRAPAPWPARC